jgi:REP element-mobilizing transposase RayT
VVFSTKERQPFIVPEMKSELYAYLGGLTRELKGKSYGIGGTSDHVHMLMSLPPVCSLSDALRFIKSNSSGWVHDRWPNKGAFGWQLGYGGFSVSRSNVPAVLKYIWNQEEHHRRITFAEELVDVLIKHEIDYDERYLWK